MQPTNYAISRNSISLAQQQSTKNPNQPNVKPVAFFCNICIVRRINRKHVTGIITSCQHVICHICYAQKIATDAQHCPKCKRSKFTAKAIDRNLPPHLIAYFTSPHATIDMALKAITFQRTQMAIVLQVQQRFEYNKRLDVALHEQRALAEWNRTYAARVDEFRLNFRKIYGYITKLQAKKGTVNEQRDTLKKALSLTRNSKNFLKVKAFPDAAVLANFKHSYQSQRKGK